MKEKALVVILVFTIFLVPLSIIPTHAQTIWTDNFADTSKIASSTGITQVTDSNGFGKTFTPYSGNPLLTLESCDPWDAGSDVTKQIPGTVHPSVLYFANGIDGYKFWMVFTPAPETGSTPPRGSGTPDYWWERPTLVRSNDGINWVKTPDYTNPIVSPGPGAWDAGWLCDPDFVYTPDQGPGGTPRWFCYYCGCGYGMSIGLAVSDDGLHYAKVDKTGDPNLLGYVFDGDSYNTRCPAALYNSTSKQFQIWYNWGSFQIGYATSTDGINWIPYNPVNPGQWGYVVYSATPGTFDQDGVTHEDVIYYQGQYWMYYLALPTSDYAGLVIGLATSPDGIHWAQYPTPVLTPGETWNFYNPTWLGGGGIKTVQSLYHPSPVMVGDTMYIYYGGVDSYTAYPGTNYETGLAFSSATPHGHVQLQQYQQSSEYPARSNTEAFYHMNEGPPPPPSYPGEYTLQDTTLAWYHFNEGTGTTAADSSGNGNDATLNNPPNQPTWTAGLYGTGLSFNGNDLLTAPNSATLNPTTAISIEAWVNPSVGKSNNYIAIKMTPNGADYAYGLKLDNFYASHSEIGAFIQDASGNMYFAYGGNVPTGTWTHVAMTYQEVSTGTTQIRLYENGVEVAYRYGAQNAATDTIPAGTSIRMNTGPLIIGCIPVAGNLYYNGIMDELRILGKALTPPQIAADGTLTATSAVVLDSSGNSNNGTPQGGVTWTTGKYSYGLSFDGSTGYVTVPESSTLDLTGAITIEAWVNPSTNKANNYIVAKETPGGAWPDTDYAYGLKLENGYTGYSEIGACIMDVSGNSYFAYGGNVPTGVWTHITMTYQEVSTGTTQIRLYENGVEVTYRYGTHNAATDAIPAGTTIRVNTAPLTLGRLPENAQGLYYNGLMDEVRVLGQALTPNEVLADYGVSYVSSGSLTSVLITPDSPWSTFTFNDALPSGTGIAYSILNGAGTVLMSSVSNNSDMSSLGETPIRLRADMTTSDPSATPTLFQWSVTSTAGPQLYIDPQSITKTTSDIGTSFKANVTVANIADLRGFDVNVTWDNTLLNLASVDFTTTLNTIWGSGNWYSTMNAIGVGYYKLVAVSTAGSFSNTAPAPLCTLTFTVQDPQSNFQRSTSIHFDTHKLSDSQANPIPHTVTDGAYSISGNVPTLQTTPNSETCRMYNQSFTVQVGFTEAFGVTAFKFEVHYNTTLLNFSQITWNAWLSGTVTVDYSNGIITGTTTGSAMDGTQTMITMQFTAAYYHIWKDETKVSGWKNDQTGLIYIQWANLTYTSGPDFKYGRGGTQNQISVGPDVTYTFSPIQGDVNNDGVVNILDLRTVAAYFDVKLGDSAWPTASAYDLHGEGIINIYDLTIVAANFGYTYI